MLDLFVVLCDHKDCGHAVEWFRSEADALARRDEHLTDMKWAESAHEPYIVTVVARKYAR